MSSSKNDPVTIAQALPAAVLQRLGAAATGFSPAQDHWILVGAEGKGVKRVAKTSDQPPRTDPGQHAIAVAGTGIETAKRARIVRMVVDIERADGSVKEVELDVANMDALFFGEGAVDKFVVPYYCATFGVKYGMTLLDRWKNNPSMAAFCHTPWSEDCTVDDD